MPKGKKSRSGNNSRVAMQAAAVRNTDKRTLEESFERFWSTPVTERQKEYLSTFDAARHLGVSQRTLQHWGDLGYIRVLPIGRRTLVEVASAKTFMMENGKVRLGV